MRSENIYNWSPRGFSLIVAVDPDPWILSFIIAFSKTRIEGILGSNYSINTNVFILFLNDIWTRLEKEQ